jgi:hypothetical protein
MTETSSNILEWDSNTEGLVTVEPFPGAVMYKVSDIVLESSDFINAIVTSIQDNGAEITEILTEDKIMGNETVFVFGELGGIAVAKEDNAEYDGVVLPEAGIYFLKLDQFITVTKLELTSGATPFTTTSEVVHKLDVKYLPDMAGADEALEDIAELGLLEVMHHDGVIYQDATGKILSY